MHIYLTQLLLLTLFIHLVMATFYDKCIFYERNINYSVNRRYRTTSNQVILKYEEKSRNKITTFQTFWHKPSSVIVSQLYLVHL